MSRSNDTWGEPPPPRLCASTTTRRGGAAWLDVSPRHPCPVCGKRSFCQLSRDGAVALCKRVGSGRKKLNRDGIEFFVHVLSGAAAVLPPALYVAHDRADVTLLDRAYTAVLEALSLDTEERAGLVARGLDDEAIADGGYRTLPARRRAELARVVVDAVGAHVAPMVPGIVRRTEGDREWWSFGGPQGLLIPLHDIGGRVTALKVRRRDPGDGQRYLYVTSSRDGGPSAHSTVHVPAPARAMGLGGGFTVVEGELKAQVCCHLLRRPVVSVPGVGAWRLAIDLARAVSAPKVAVAYDMDALTNPMVARARADFVAGLRAAGITPRLIEWPAEHKGLDDYLYARRVEAAA